MDYNEFDVFPKFVMIQKPSQQKLRLGRSVGVSPELLNFKVNVKMIQIGSCSHKEVVLKPCSFLHRFRVRST